MRAFFKVFPVIIGIAAVPWVIYSAFLEDSLALRWLLFVAVMAWLLLLIMWREETHGPRLCVFASILAGAVAVALFDLFVRGQGVDSRVARAALCLPLVFLQNVVKYVYLGTVRALRSVASDPSGCWSDPKTVTVSKIQE